MSERIVQRPAVSAPCTCGGGCPRCAGPARVSARAEGEPVDSPIALAGLATPSQPLPLQQRLQFESTLQTPLQGVSLHTDATAAASARALHARAYTAGNHIVFGAGRYAPHNSAGQRLLAHELTHVAQQRRSAGPAVLQREGDTPPAAATEDCDATQAASLNAYLNSARAWVNFATARIVSYTANYASSRHCAPPPTTGIDGVVRQVLIDNFHTDGVEGVPAIKDGFIALRDALNSAFTFECEADGCETDVAAYVRGAFAPIRRMGDVHVCPLFFNCGNYFLQVTMLIHERAHQYPGTDSDTYEWEDGYATLGLAESIDNADSYAVTARQILHGGALGAGSQRCIG